MYKLTHCKSKVAFTTEEDIDKKLTVISDWEAGTLSKSRFTEVKSKYYNEYELSMCKMYGADYIFIDNNYYFDSVL